MTAGLLVFLVLCVFFYAASGSNATSSESLDVVLHKHAFGALVHHRPLTGALYVAPLPTDLAGIQVAVLRMRSKTLWTKGANFSNFQIPPRTLSVPYVRRVLLVYQDLGNQSSQYYNITGYSLVSSVVGFMVYDASNFTINNITKLDLSTTGTRISVQFPNLTFESGTNPKTSCAIFSADGKVSITGRSLNNSCYTRNAGHFSIVTPLQRNENTRKIWVIGTVLGFVLLICGSFLGVVCVKMFKLKKTHEMEKAASEGEHNTKNRVVPLIVKITEQRVATLRIHASEEAALMELLNSMYINTLSTATHSGLLNLLMAADKYEVVSCMQMQYCSHHLSKLSMTCDLAVSYMNLPCSLLHVDALQQLTDLVKQFIVDQFKDINNSLETVELDFVEKSYELQHFSNACRTLSAPYVRSVL
ncbi:Atpob [Heracleum sosnowskyi]|uniref:Atpob n=1 Tax=Heracleum sosnowskyi TaxID=360622 RepID=A0AAD8MJA4_9APIA|nr:Atpob [Heracleum sosnowskyi]